MKNTKYNDKWLGIIGGGQLAWMIIKAAKKYGIKTCILDPVKHCTASKECDLHILGNFNDKKKLETLFKKSDIVTYEFENIDIKNLVHVNNKYKKCIQTEYPLFISQSREKEKNFVRNLGIPTTSYFIIHNLFELEIYLARNKNKNYILKTNRMGYDGYNQLELNYSNFNKCKKAISEMFKISSLILEEKYEFIKEASVILVQDKDNNVYLCSVNENIHKKGVLIKSSTLNDLKIKKKLIKKSKIITNSIGCVGIYSIEYFIGKKNEIIFNELAPRVHNSGHHTIENYNQSQFDLHVKILFNIKIKKQIMNNNYTLINVIGENYTKYSNLLRKNDIIFYDYFKDCVRTGRKMGHIIINKDNINKWYKKLNEFKK